MRAILLLLAVGCAAEPDASILGAASTAPRDGVDYSWGRPSPSGLRDLGFTFAARYLSFDTTGKDLQADEAEALHAAGVDVVLVFENHGRDPLGGFDAGVEHAQRAEERIAEIGAPPALPVYFAVDFQVVASEWPAVEAYFDGIATVMPVARIGAYGGIDTVAHLFDTGRIAYGWQTFAWSHGQWDDRAQVRQVDNGVVIAGGQVDLDLALVDEFGQWPAPPRVPTVSTFTECGVLHAGEMIGTDRALPSCDGRYLFAQQTDGNLVLYGPGGAKWASWTNGTAGDRAVMQGDGNAVVYSASGRPLWDTGTWGNPGAELYLQTDGNLVVYAPGGIPLWASGTNE